MQETLVVLLSLENLQFGIIDIRSSLSCLEIPQNDWRNFLREKWLRHPSLYVVKWSWEVLTESMECYFYLYMSYVGAKFHASRPTTTNRLEGK